MPFAFASITFESFSGLASVVPSPSRLRGGDPASFMPEPDAAGCHGNASLAAAHPSGTTDGLKTNCRQRGGLRSGMLSQLQLCLICLPFLVPFASVFCSLGDDPGPVNFVHVPVLLESLRRQRAGEEEQGRREKTNITTSFTRRATTTSRTWWQ